MTKKDIISILILAAFFAGGFFLPDPSPQILIEPISEVKVVKIVGQEISVELAQTTEEKNMGLSGRESLSSDRGMLFIFDQSGKYSFWMQDMNFPIDIIWLDENLQVVYFESNVQPESFPESYVSDTDAKYVLELTAGFAEINNLQIGDEVEFVY